MTQIINKFFLIVLFFVISNCGYKVLNNLETNNFNIKEISTSGDKRINFKIKKFGVVLYSYHVKGTEYYKDEKLIKFNSKTNQNDKHKYVNLKLEDGEYTIDGSSYKGKASMDYLLGTWWNHSIVKAPAQISAISGRIIKQKVTFLGKETINIEGKSYNTLHFNFSSTDKKLKKGKNIILPSNLPSIKVFLKFDLLIFNSLSL